MIWFCCSILVFGFVLLRFMSSNKRDVGHAENLSRDCDTALPSSSLDAAQEFDRPCE